MLGHSVLARRQEAEDAKEELLFFRPDVRSCTKLHVHGALEIKKILKQDPLTIARPETPAGLGLFLIFCFILISWCHQRSPSLAH